MQSVECRIREPKPRVPEVGCSESSNFRPDVQVEIKQKSAAAQRDRARVLCGRMLRHAIMQVLALERGAVAF